MYKSALAVEIWMVYISTARPMKSILKVQTKTTVDANVHLYTLWSSITI